MLILGIDPGTTQSALVIIDPTQDPPRIVDYTKEANHLILGRLYDEIEPIGHAAIEEVVSYGMRVGREIFDTVRWSGRFQEALVSRYNEEYVHLISRRTVKMLMCNTLAATDSAIRHRVISLYGGRTAIGGKYNPGPLYGITGDVWQALALAITARACILRP